MSLNNTFYKCSTRKDDTFGKIDVLTTQGDKQLRSNKPTKEFQKFLLAFDVVEALLSEFDKIKEDLEISITNYMFKPEKFYDDWTKEASENACSKGHTVLYKDKILPQLSQVKSYRNNTTGVVTDEIKNKFHEAWIDTKVNEIEDFTMKEEILKVVENMTTEDPKKPVIEIPEVQKVLGTAKVCWGCFSGICRTRQYIGQPILHKKAINRFCPK